jgi:hypothetical protein
MRDKELSFVIPTNRLRDVGADLLVVRHDNEVSVNVLRRTVDIEVVVEM